MEKVNVEVVVGLMNRNRDKTKRQFNLARAAINQLKEIHDDMKANDNLSSYSSIIEQAMEAYYKIYMSVKKLEKKL